MTVDLGNRKVLDDGTVLCGEDAVMEMLYSGLDLDGVIMTPCHDADLFSAANRMLDAGLTEPLVSDAGVYREVDWFGAWMTPEPYASMDVLSLCIERCTTDEQRIRVCEEYKLFDERGMVPVLRHLTHMVDDLRSRGVTWGVGRGSSVSSYILFLIGINRIDPMRFDLDVREFLK